MQAVEAAEHATQPASPKLKCVPVFTTAATTGAGLSVLHAFLSHLQPHKIGRSFVSSAEGGSTEQATQKAGCFGFHSPAEPL